MDSTRTDQKPSSLGAAKEAAADFVSGELKAGQQKVADLADSVLAAGRDKVDAELKGSAAQVDEIKSAIGNAADQLRSRRMNGIAHYTEQLATSLGSFSERLRVSSVDQLAADARDFARSHPALFVAGSVAVGLALTRLLKASPVPQAAEPTRSDGLAGSTGRNTTDGAAKTTGYDAPSWPISPPDTAPRWGSDRWDARQTTDAASSASPRI